MRKRDIEQGEAITSPVSLSLLKNKMAIKCTICNERINSLGMFCIITCSGVGSMALSGMVINNQIIQGIVGIFGLVFGFYIIYLGNPLHIRHTILKKYFGFGDKNG